MHEFKKYVWEWEISCLVAKLYAVVTETTIEAIGLLFISDKGFNTNNF